MLLKTDIDVGHKQNYDEITKTNSETFSETPDSDRENEFEKNVFVTVNVRRDCNGNS